MMDEEEKVLAREWEVHLTDLVAEFLKMTGRFGEIRNRDDDLHNAITIGVYNETGEAFEDTLEIRVMAEFRKASGGTHASHSEGGE